jgi:hypothetical protein
LILIYWGYLSVEEADEASSRVRPLKDDDFSRPHLTRCSVLLEALSKQAK